MAGAEKGAFLDEADQLRRTANIATLKADLLGDISKGGKGGLLNEAGIRVRPAMNPNQSSNAFLVRTPRGSQWYELDVPDAFKQASGGKFELAVKRILDKSDEISVRELDELKVGLGKVADTDPAAHRVLRMMQHNVRDRLGQVSGYDEAIRPIAQFKGEADVIARKMGTPRIVSEGATDVNPEQLGRSMAQAYSPGMTQADQAAAVQSIDEMLPGRGIRERAAGLGFAKTTPAGLAERSQLFRALSAAIGTGAAAAVNPILAIPALALYSPRVAARALVGFGQLEARAAEISAVVRRMVAQALEVCEAWVTEGMAAAMNRYNKAQET